MITVEIKHNLLILYLEPVKVEWMQLHILPVSLKKQRIENVWLTLSSDFNVKLQKEEQI